MTNSRRIEDLLVPVQSRCRRLLDDCHKAGIDVMITSTYRDNESQNALYAQGRTKPGKRVTNAKGGQSYHNWRVAFDVLPLRHGKPVWGTRGNGIDNNPADDERDDLELWQRIGAIGKACGLAWAGDWKGDLREFAHFQYTAGLSLADFQQGKTIKIV